MNDTKKSFAKVFITCSLDGVSPLISSLGIVQPRIDIGDKAYEDKQNNNCTIFKQHCEITGAHIFTDSYLNSVGIGCKQLKNVSYCSSSDTQLPEKSKDLLTDFRLEGIADSDFILSFKWNEQFSKDELMELSFAVSLDKLVVLVKSPGVIVPERLKDSNNCSIITDRDELRGLKTGFLTGFTSFE